MARQRSAELKDFENANKLSHYAERSSSYTANSLKSSRKNGIINIKIDEFTPCLRDNKTGEIVPTSVIQITDKKLLKQYTEKSGWYINWAQVPKDVEVYKLTVKGSDEAQGLIALFNEPSNLAVKIHWGVAAPQNNPLKVGKENKVYNGVGGHLFAIAAEKSVDYGYDGYMYADAANNTLLEYYMKEFGAELMGCGNGYRFRVNEKNAHELLDKYNYEWEDK